MTFKAGDRVVTEYSGYAQHPNLLHGGKGVVVSVLPQHGVAEAVYIVLMDEEPRAAKGDVGWAFYSKELRHG